MPETKKVSCRSCGAVFQIKIGAKNNGCRVICPKCKNRNTLN